MSAGTTTFHPVKLIYGKLVNEIFNRQEFCLVTHQNGLSLKNYGSAMDLALKYPYGDIAGKRSPCPYFPAIARKEDRNRAGIVHVRPPPLYVEGPIIATVIVQYGIGTPIDVNVKSQHMKSHPDPLVGKSLEKDTTEGRCDYFNRSLYMLADELRKSENEVIKKILIPAGIGRCGLDEVWVCRYAPIIAAFARDMHTLGKEVVLVTTESYINYVEKTFVNRENEAVRNCFNAIKNLTVLSSEDLSLDITMPYEDVEEEEEEEEVIIPKYIVS